MGFFTKNRKDFEGPARLLNDHHLEVTYLGDGKFKLTRHTNDFRPTYSVIVADNTCVITENAEGIFLTPVTGLDRVRAAIKADRGGDAPVQVQGYA